ncbi:RsmB/NOP family class I SAM-dependent RNA methyltransferase [Mesorhizobium sp. RP14(2022)]|uniref:RsmB/NOP family class I SAM-dependent RNA methyltransferase n=1 Tax=Mesorhizobium liriopis TaxID=2953882 RepID=A0ABT1C2N4_9HYPH|nr:RsmB/NOP family class I SAM-dependent RNA methyltransferase [Mesorhizobium liriopis]MCO6049079.1 RsmB/NOP family class I SAM-dependent RNA methyltransferase [Mesorhizobium liriopis]
MRIGGRIQAAIEVLEDIDKRHRPVADALKDWGVSHRFAGSGDRAAIGNIVYDALRHRRSAAFLMGEETARARAFGAMLLESGWTLDRLAEALEGDRFAPPPPTEAERAAVADNRLEDAAPEVRADLPDWCVAPFTTSFGDDWVAEAQAMALRPPLDLRVNVVRATRERMLRTLEEFSAASANLAPHGIRIPPIAGEGRHPNVQAEPAFQQGFFEVQDEGSQIAAELAGARPGETVLDFCAGAGGKTLALSVATQNSGRIVAHDAEKPRLAPIFDRLRRAEATNVEVVARLRELDDLKGACDLVLVDAPCTGSGTWRRRPDAKWRLSQRQLDVRLGEQRAILDQAASFVRVNGRLAYITCSVFEAENGAQVAAFLERNPGFAPVDHRALWEEHFPGRSDKARFHETAGLMLSPLKSGTDGFFFALLERRG